MLLCRAYALHNNEGRLTIGKVTDLAQSDFVSSILTLPLTIRAGSSIGKSVGLLLRRLWVQVLPGPLITQPIY